MKGGEQLEHAESLTDNTLGRLMTFEEMADDLGIVWLNEFQKTLLHAQGQR